MTESIVKSFSAPLSANLVDPFMTTKACTALLNEPLIWMLTPHGDGWALGWKGPQAFRELAYNMWANLHEPHNGVSPIHITLNDSTSYVYLANLAAIKKVLTLHFYLHAIRDQEIEVTKGWVDDEYVYEPNEEQATKLATESADAFMLTIKNVGFIPSLPKPHGDTYTLGRLNREEYTPVENYASAATA